MIASCQAYTLPVATNVRISRAADGVVTVTAAFLEWSVAAGACARTDPQTRLAMLRRTAARADCVNISNHPPITGWKIIQGADILSAS
jgi:hypothetical protein